MLNALYAILSLLADILVDVAKRLLGMAFLLALAVMLLMTSLVLIIQNLTN